MDQLVKLYDIPDSYEFLEKITEPDITIRKPIGPEKHIVVQWVKDKFNNAWSSEIDMALCNRPISCFLALKGKTIVGFSCYDASALGFFGPTGVDAPFQKKGIGAALLMVALMDMKQKGYGYAIIGSVGPAEFYKKVVGATDIANSTPGIWKTWVQ